MSGRAFKAQSVFPRMVELRRTFHRHPELAFEEEQTARTIMEELDRLGISYDYSGKGGAVVGRLRDRHDVTVALRAEMDALPGAENTDLPFASSMEGKMHACGHDAHVAILLGAAGLIVERKDALCGTIVLCFQPAEEGKGGAAAMVAAGVLDDPHVDVVYGLHVWSQAPCGVISTRPGPMMAASDSIEITIKGRGGHGAQPDHTIDPITTAAQFISTVQTVVSRKLDPLEPTGTSRTISPRRSS